MVEKRGEKSLLISLFIIVAGMFLAGFVSAGSCNSQGSYQSTVCRTCPDGSVKYSTGSCTYNPYPNWVVTGESCPSCPATCSGSAPNGASCNNPCGVAGKDSGININCQCSNGNWQCGCQCHKTGNDVFGNPYVITSCDSNVSHAGYCCSPYSCGTMVSNTGCGGTVGQSCGISVCVSGTYGTYCPSGQYCTSQSPYGHCCPNGYVDSSGHCCPSGQVWDTATSKCKVPCTPQTCAQLGANCGSVSDGCGGTLNCGTCTGTNQQCSSSHVCACIGPSCGSSCCGSGQVCVSTPGGSNCCTLSSCPLPDSASCGTHILGNCQQDCGTGTKCTGVNQQCISGSCVCTPKTCSSLGATCGTQSDGCGGILNCGTCAAASCSENASGSGTATSASTCTGGTCSSTSQSTCNLGFGCCGTGCCSTCTTNGDCATGYSCVSGTCGKCTIASVAWTYANGTSLSGKEVEDATAVKMKVTGNNFCNGQTVTFRIREAQTNGSSRTIGVADDSITATFDSSNTASGSWTATWISDTAPGETNPPEFYFGATISGQAGYTWSGTASDQLLYVIKCGDGVKNGNEECDGTQGTCPAGCVQSTCKCITDYCGDGVVKSPNSLGVNEVCDSGANNGKAGNCWTDCLRQTKYCGNGIIEKPNDFGVNEVCDSAQQGCKSDCSGWDTSVYWAASADGANITSLSICAGRSESLYTILKYSGLANTPVTIQIWNDLLIDAKIKDLSAQTDENGNVDNTSWQITNEDITALGTGTKQLHFDFYNGGSKIKTSENLALTIQNSDYCSSKLTCGDYSSESECSGDTAGVADTTVNAYFESIGSDLKCGVNGVNCKCEWTSSSTCEGAYEAVEAACNQDGNCNPFCSPADPDCGAPNTCGNGKEELLEQCDDGNTNDGDGCSANCTIEDNIQPPCIEGTTLCSDGTCSIRCPVSDTADAACNNNGVCDTGEGCSCSDCNGKVDTCKSSLLCSLTDSHCCSSVSNNICNPYCSKVDPDCKAGRVIGTCHIKSEIEANCDETNRLRTISLITNWTGNEGAAKQKCENLNGKTISTPCPEQVQLPFFDYLEMGITIALIALIYISMIFRNKFRKRKKF